MIDNIIGIHRPMMIALVVFGAVAQAQPASPASWQTELWNGQQVTVEPTTKRATVQSADGSRRPLWDGVHRLSDGSTVTIRSGVAIPHSALPITPQAVTAPSEPGVVETGSAPETTTMTSPPTPVPGTDSVTRDSDHGYCNQLVLKTCGIRSRCAESDPCQLARQLRDLKHRPKDSPTDNTRWAEAKCHDALGDEAAFTSCTLEPPIAQAACTALVEHVCLGADRCQRSPLCRRARYLHGMERSLLARSAATEITLVRQQCVELLAEHAFFPPCR